jgi:hypothetical protein
MNNLILQNMTIMFKSYWKQRLLSGAYEGFISVTVEIKSNPDDIIFSAKLNEPAKLCLCRVLILCEER